MTEPTKKPDDTWKWVLAWLALLIAAWVYGDKLGPAPITSVEFEQQWNGDD